MARERFRAGQPDPDGGQVWGPGPTPSSAWVVDPGDVDVAGRMIGDLRGVITRTEQAARLGRAALVVASAGVVLAGDRSGSRGLFGYPREALVHLEGCQEAADPHSKPRIPVQRAAAIDAVLRDDPVLLASRSGQAWRSVSWCGRCIAGDRR